LVLRTDRPSPGTADDEYFTNIFVRKNMSVAVIVILLVLWLVGVVTAHTFGGLLHLLFLAALIVFVANLISPKRIA